MLVVWSIPYGLGAGAVDAALNSFVAEHYSSRHMSWLHAFWGVGASAGPYMMSYALISRNSWEYGYSSVGIIQIGLTFLLLMSLPIWKKQSELSAQKKIGHHHLKISEALKIKGVKHILIAFFAYCALEATTGLWASTYLVIHKGIQAEIAARWASLFYLGITGGRFLSGFISERFGNRNMIRIGLILIAIGLIVILIPSEIEIITLLGLIVTGLGCAPIYPSIIHETPTSFGAQNAQSIIGIQMASAYVGTTLMPPLFGVLGDYVSISLYPIYLLILLFIIWNMTEKLTKIVTQNAN
jgi:fucose permease